MAQRFSRLAPVAKFKLSVLASGSNIFGQADPHSAVGLPRPLDIMREAVTIEISNQLSEVLSVIERHLESTLLAVHLYGSAVDGGLKPYSDIDLLVTVAVKLDETTRRALLNDLMEASAFPGERDAPRYRSHPCRA